MVLTTSELITALQNEVRVLLHLASKVDRTKLDYRPTPNQRSTAELLKYLSMMGPTLVRYILAEPPDVEIWTKAEDASKLIDVDQAVLTIAGHHDLYASLLDVPQGILRAEVTDFDGKTTSRGAFIVNLGLCGSAAYRMQLFLYLKASGQADLDSSNLWAGVDRAAV